MVSLWFLFKRAMKRVIEWYSQHKNHTHTKPCSLRGTQRSMSQTGGEEIYEAGAGYLEYQYRYQGALIPGRLENRAGAKKWLWVNGVGTHVRADFTKGSHCLLEFRG